jgi:hypothetical protein
VYSVSGKVHDATGNGIGGVSVTISGEVSQTVTTLTDGTYRFVNIPGNKPYTIAAKKDGWVMSPVSLSISMLVSSMANNDFTATPVPVTPPDRFSISGVIKDTNGNPIPDVAVTLSSGASVTVKTAADGSYQFLDLYGNKDYIITPEKSGWKFTESILEISGLDADSNNNNFIGRHAYVISGRVSNVGIYLPGVTLKLEGSVVLLTVTNEDGYYEFTDLPENEAYTIMTVPSGDGLIGAASIVKSIAMLKNSVTDLNFNAVALVDTMPSNEVKILGSTEGRGTINPDRGEKAQIMFNGREVGKYELRIFDLQGNMIKELSLSDVSRGVFEWFP